MLGLLQLVQRGGDWAWPQPAQAPPRCTKCRLTAHPSTASVLITVLLYNGPLVSGFNVPIKGLTVSFVLVNFLLLCNGNLQLHNNRKLTKTKLGS